MHCFVRFVQAMDGFKVHILLHIVFYKESTRWFKYDRDICGLFTHKSVPVIFEPPCTFELGSIVIKESKYSVSL